MAIVHCKNCDTNTPAAQYQEEVYGHLMRVANKTAKAIFVDFVDYWDCCILLIGYSGIVLQNFGNCCTTADIYCISV